MPTYRSTALLCLCLASAACPGFAATPTQTADERPRIGLVLSGGGARGAAHVGVLKALEDMRIPVDAVAGASMGAIIGGLYASGLDAGELEALLRSIDWRSAFSDAVDRRHRNFRRRQDDQEFLVKLDVGLRNGSLALPRGFLQGQNINAILRGATFRVAGIDDFDHLPTPFRAVATDLVSGEAYIFDSGSLSRAMRASMTVPGVFEPVPIDGRLLVDGGVVANLPLDLLQDFDCDVVIAVDVSEPLLNIDGLRSAVDVSNQMITIFMRRQTEAARASLDEGDVFIRPELGNFGSTEFARVPEAIPAGEAAARRAGAALAPLAVSREDYAAYRNLRRQRVPPPPKIQQANRTPAAAGKAASKALPSFDDLETAVQEAFGTGQYALVEYDVVSQDGVAVADFAVVPKPWGPNYLRFGASLEDDFEGRSDFNLGFRYTRTGLNQHGAEWRTDLRLGASPLLASELYLPWQSTSPFYFATRAAVGQNDLKLFTAGEGQRRYRVTEADLSVALGKEIGRAADFRIGLRRAGGRARLKLGSPDPSLGSRFNFDSGELFAQLQLDSLDSVAFPTRGTLASLRWTGGKPSLGADGSFELAELSWSTATTIQGTTLVGGVDIASTLESGAGVQDLFGLGGFLRLSGLESDSLTGPHRGIARLIGYRRMRETGGGLFELPWYVGASLEVGNVWQDRSDARLDTLKLGGSVFTGLDTFAGPLYFALGISEGGERAVYLFLGQPFRQRR